MRTWILTLFVDSMLASAVVAAPLAYTGYTISFSKAAFDDHTLPINQDRILSDIIITRANLLGIFNIAQEEAFELNVSPLGTAWAFPQNNPDLTLSAAECSDGCPEFTFEDWQTALGGSGTGGPLTTVGQDAIVHLIDQDIYLDIRFTSWAIGLGGGGGGFAYERAEITPSADFDRDGDVDGRDFLTWQRNHGAADPLQTGGDANFNGSVDGDDLEVWQAAYGGALTALTAVPEPNSFFLVGSISLSLFVYPCRHLYLSTQH